MTNKLQAIREAVLAANPAKKEEWGIYRLADVLLAMRSLDAETIWAIDISSGQFFGQNQDNGHPKYYAEGIWNLLRDDLSLQPKETIDFLYELLTKQ